MAGESENLKRGEQTGDEIENQRQSKAVKPRARVVLHSPKKEK